MSQSTNVIPDSLGSTFLTNINAALAAILTAHSGATRPSYLTGTKGFWIDTSASPVYSYKYFDGTDDITIFTVNINTNVTNLITSSILSANTIWGQQSVGVAGSQTCTDFAFLLLSDATKAAMQTRLGLNTASFSANKNSTDQTGIASVTPTKVTFTNEVSDVGSFYDAANSKWTPPAGRVLISANVYWSAALSVNALYKTMIYKNGASICEDLDWTGSVLANQNNVSFQDTANGTDYYEIYCYGTSSSTLTIDGTSLYTNFRGEWFGIV